MSSEYQHHHGAGMEHEGKLWITLALTAGFMIAEIVGGLLTNSLALLSDAAHMFTDAAALAVSLAAIRVAKRAADHKRTFGLLPLRITHATIQVEEGPCAQASAEARAHIVHHGDRH